MAEDSTPEAKAVSSSCSSRARASRSRCFHAFKWIIILLILVMLVVTLAATPWMPDYVRQVLADLNMTSSVALNYSETEPLQVTDNLVYAIIGLSVFLTVVYTIVGVIALIRESFCLCIAYGLLTLVIGGTGICCTKYVWVLVSTVACLTLAPLIITFAVLIKRADRLAPESSQMLTNEEDGQDSLKKKKSKKQQPPPEAPADSDEVDPDNVRV